MRRACTNLAIGLLGWAFTRAVVAPLERALRWREQRGPIGDFGYWDVGYEDAE